MRAQRVQPAALAAVLVALAGCGGSDPQSAPETVPTTSPSATTEPVPTETSSQEPKPKPKPKPNAASVFTVRVVGGKPQGGIARPSVKRNDRVVLVVRSDLADEVHLHGYDISRPVAAGGRARLTFVAKIPGRFEVELEDRGIQIAELTVR